MSYLMPTRDELLRWAPKAKREYIDTFLELESTLQKAGILHHPLILCHFLGQIGAETNGLTIIRENMNYRSVERIRQVWPARSRKTSDAVLAGFVGNPVALSDWAYGGRMGNKKGSEDGFLYRGGGPMQTTGKYAAQKYCRACGIPFTPEVLDDIKNGWLFAIHEWVSSGCSSYALENDILSVSKIINTGSAKSGVAPNGLDHRKRWLKRAWAIWGDARPVAETSTLSLDKLKKEGSETLKATDLLKVGGAGGAISSLGAGAAVESGAVVKIPNESTEQVIEQVKNHTESVDAISSLVSSIKSFWLLISTNLWVMGFILACLAYWVARKIDWRRLIDARLGWNLHRLGDIAPVEDTLLDDPDEAVIPRG